LKKTNRRFLAYAVAIAASFGTVPGITQAAPAEETAAVSAAESVQQEQAVSTAAEVGQPEKTTAEAAQPVAEVKTEAAATAETAAASGGAARIS
jgi:outer membrane protein insertion porin family